MFVRHPFDNRERELVECATDGWTCKSILKSDNNIGSPIETGDGRILFVASPNVVGGDGRRRYGRYDFWLHSPGNVPRKLTNLQLYHLSSTSVTNDAVNFSAYGPNPKISAIPKYDPDAAQQSDIFKLPFSPMKVEIESPNRMLTPLFLGDGKAISPAASSDGATIAFLRTRLGIGNYHYELVIRKEGGDRAEQVFPAPGLGFSKPIVLDHTVYTNGIGISSYSIRAVSPGDETTRSLAEISDAAIESYSSGEGRLA